MTEKDRKDFAQAVGALLETFGTEATEPLLRGYWIGLCDLDLLTVQAVVAKAIRHCDRLPKPAELRKLSGEQTGESKAISAWADVQRALPYGPYKHIDFQDKRINAVVRNLGGWPTFCERFTDAESEKWVRLEFVKAYQAFESSGVDGEACRPLTGLAQVQAIDGVVGPCQPRLIECDPERAKGITYRGSNPLAIERV